MAQERILESWSVTSLSDALGAVLGAELGVGSDRRVYDLNPAWPGAGDWVAKVSTSGNQNVMEWELWQTLKGLPRAARWLAPCGPISLRGDLLLQRRTQPVPVRRLPKRLPDWLTDFKPDNFGMLDGKVVCHDYGTVSYVIKNIGGVQDVKWITA